MAGLTMAGYWISSSGWLPKSVKITLYHLYSTTIYLQIASIHKYVNGIYFSNMEKKDVKIGFTLLSAEKFFRLF